MNKYFFNVTLLLIIASLLFANCSDNKSSIIYEEKSINEIKAIALDENKDICIVLHEDSTAIFATFMDKLNTDFKRLRRKSIFNVVNLDNEENQWYQQWLCLNNSVVTCIFSSNGELKNIIGGASSYSFKTIEAVIDNDLRDISFGYKSPLSLDEKKIIPFLNKVLFCKNSLGNCVDIDKSVSQTIEDLVYPYNLYLKIKNMYSIRKDTMTAINLSNRLLLFKKNKKYAKLYQDIFDETEYIVNPNYNPDSLSYLVTKKMIYLPDCKINETKNINIEVNNQGKSLLVIDEIDLGCDCLSIDSTFNKTIYPYSKDNIKIQFTPKSRADSIKHLFIISNAINYFEQIDIKATIN